MKRMIQPGAVALAFSIGSPGFAPAQTPEQEQKEQLQLASEMEKDRAAKLRYFAASAPNPCAAARGRSPRSYWMRQARCADVGIESNAALRVGARPGRRARA